MALRERGDGGRREAGKRLAGWVRTELFRLLTKDQTRTNLTKADEVGENSVMGVLYQPRGARFPTQCAVLLFLPTASPYVRYASARWAVYLTATATHIVVRFLRVIALPA